MTKVLVVDDDPALRFMMQGILEEHGLEVVTTDNAIDALTMLDDIDVVVSDYAMPEMDGMERVQRLRQRMLWQNHAVAMGALLASRRLPDRRQPHRCRKHEHEREGLALVFPPDRSGDRVTR